MKISKLLTVMMCALMGVIPFVAADFKSGPEIVVLPLIIILVLVGCVFAAIGLVRFIIRKTKKDDVKSINEKTSLETKNTLNNVKKQ